MTESMSRQGLMRFGVFQVDLEAGLLRKNGRRVRLQEQPFQVLAMLSRLPPRPMNCVTSKPKAPRTEKNSFLGLRRL